jgi:hypothetical protein
MKKLAMAAVLCLFGAMVYTTGCGGGTPNCDKAVSDLQACCDKATTTKTTCDEAVTVLKQAQTAAAQLGTDCGAPGTIDCSLYK